MGYSFDSSPSHVRSSKMARHFLLCCFLAPCKELAAWVGRDRGSKLKGFSTKPASLNLSYG